MDPRSALEKLPDEIKERIYQELSIKDLMELRSTSKYFRAHIDEVVAQQRYTLAQLRTSKYLMKLSYQHYYHVIGNADAFTDILQDYFSQNIFKVDSEELTNKIINTINHIEEMVKLFESKPQLESNSPPQLQLEKIETSQNKFDNISTHFNKILMILGSFNLVLILGVTMFSGMAKWDEKTIYHQIFLIIIALLFVYFVYDRVKDFTNNFAQENHGHHNRVVNIANQNLLLLKTMARQQQKSNSKITYLWNNREKFLKMGTKQLDQPATGMEILLPKSTIDLNQLKEDWRQSRKPQSN